MYHKAGISQLSNMQISRLLNNHGVRVSHGSNHEVELSKEQLKKLMKATEKGKAMTLTLDPFQIQNHQHLRGSGSGGSSGGKISRSGKYNKWVDTLGARPVIQAGMTKAASSISGSGVRSDLYVRAHQKDSQKLIGKYMPSMPKYDVVEPPLKIGFGLKKRKAPKRQSMKGCALMPAGY